MFEILSADEMRKAEQAAIAGGVTGIQLMTAAGTAVVHEIVKMTQPCAVLVLCGPGNNGGDGFIVAHLLKKEGWAVRVACPVKRNALKGDAALAAQKWDGEVESLSSNLGVHKTDLVVDAIFGTGFDRALDPELVTLFDKIRTRKIPVVAVDIPSGINASTGAADPGALKAVMTVTFTRKKTGHMLLPGKLWCGKLILAGIGMVDETVTSLSASCFENHAGLWIKNMPLPGADTHKYMRGHVLVYGGEKRTGAACLAAAAAQKAGAGAVTITSPARALPIYAGYRASFMVDECNNIDEIKAVLRDERKNAVVIGPGAGSLAELRQSVEAVLGMNKSGVLDADVFSAYHGNAKDLFTKLSPKFVLTPHEGEFVRLFGVLEGSKVDRARAAAKMSNAIVVLKGSDTVIAAPDGAAVINTNAPPTLATAGSGDVLAGLIAGLIAQGMPPFMAACAAVWIHSEAARNYGLGLTAEDIITQSPQVLNSMFSHTAAIA